MNKKKELLQSSKKEYTTTTTTTVKVLTNQDKLNKTLELLQMYLDDQKAINKKIEIINQNINKIINSPII